jgi:hypothetical protein
MSDDNNEIVIGVNGYDAAQTYDNTTYSSGIDTITLSPSTYGVDLSSIRTSGITFPASPTYYAPGATVGGSTRIGGLPNGTVPNGGYTISTGAGTGHNWTTGTTNTTSTVEINADGMKIKEGGDITIGGKSLSEAINKIEERLGILNPNPELEERWDKLKELRKQYIEMERDLLEKEKIMKILKEA